MLKTLQEFHNVIEEQLVGISVKTHFKQYHEDKLKYGCVKKDVNNIHIESASKTIRKVEKISLPPDYNIYRDSRTGQIYITHEDQLNEVSVH
jgi:hypothetical protein